MSTVTTPAPATTAVPALGPVVRPSFVKLTRVELRKAVDYRAGRWILFVITGLSLLALGWRVLHAGDQPVIFWSVFTDALGPAAILIPVLGVLAMTAEWTQRTALTTFTLTPRRVPVLLAKLVGALLLMLAAMAVVAVLAVLTTVICGLITDGSVDWSVSGKDVAGQVVSQGLFVLMGGAFGAIIRITGVALTAFFVAPTLYAILADAVLKSKGEWFDVFSAFDRIGQFSLQGKGWQTLTAVTVWVLAPLVVGIWMSNRREVK